MSDINLLPSEYGPDPAVAKVSSKITRVAVVEFGILVVFALVAIGSFFVLSSRVDESTTAQDELKTSIASLEATEQRLFLLKDRIEKAGTILAAETAADELEGFEFIQTSLPEGVQFVKVEFFTNKMEVVYSFADSSSVVNLLSLLESSGRFSRIELLSLDYTEINGYELALSLVE